MVRAVSAGRNASTWARSSAVAARRSAYFGQQLGSFPLGAKAIKLRAFAFALSVPKHSDDALDLFQSRVIDGFPLLRGEHAVESLPEATTGLPRGNRSNCKRPVTGSVCSA